jgi:hypothetical protein
MKPSGGLFGHERKFWNVCSAAAPAIGGHCKLIDAGKPPKSTIAFRCCVSHWDWDDYCVWRSRFVAREEQVPLRCPLRNRAWPHAEDLHPIPSRCITDANVPSGSEVSELTYDH